MIGSSARKKCKELEAPPNKAPVATITGSPRLPNTPGELESSLETRRPPPCSELPRSTRCESPTRSPGNLASLSPFTTSTHRDA